MIINYEFALRVFMAGVSGALIGYERTNRNKEAGIRTHAIVALSAALMMIISKYAFIDTEKFDSSRVASQIVSGVGFLGAGIIFVRNKTTISGLTTAAGLWGTAGVGMAIGAGMYSIGIITMLLIVVIQIYFHRDNFLSRNEAYRYILRMQLRSIDIFANIKQDMIYRGMQIEYINIVKRKEGEVELEIELLMRNSYSRFEMLENLLDKPEVISAIWE